MKINWLHIVNSIAGGAAVVAGLNPALFGPYAPQAAIGIGVATVLANVLHAVIAAPTPPSDSTPKLHFVTVVLTAVLVASIFAGCASMTPTQKAGANAGATVAVQVAAGFAIQQKSNDPAVWKARAVEFKAIAFKLEDVNNAGTATLATLAADLAPLVAKLPPADQLGANAAVAALVPFLQGQLQANPSAGAVQAEIQVVLTAFIAACEAYGA